MNNKEFYQATFSQVYSHKTVRWEDFERMKKRKNLRRLFAVAAAAALMAALTGLAVAQDWFGLRELLLPQQNQVNVVEDGIATDETTLVDVISLSGYLDTPESKALAEWNAFTESYDADGSIIASIGNQPTGFEETYGLYLVYTQEMADKLEEILAKYNLRLHTELQVIPPELWTDAVGAAFLAENHTVYSGYIYEDGTFQYDGAAQIPGYGKIDYQFRRAVRGSFNDVILNVQDLAEFQEWKYLTACGVTVNLALSDGKALILVDLGDSFITVNVLAGTETSPEDVFSSGSITGADLEALADSINFTALAEIRTPDMEQLAQAEERLINGLGGDEESDPLWAYTGIEQAAAEVFVQELADLLAGGERLAVAERFAYPCNVKTDSGMYTVDSPESLLEYYDEAIGPYVYELLDELQNGELFAYDGLVGVGNGAAWFGLVEDGEIRLFTLQAADWNGVRPVEEITAG